MATKIDSDGKTTWQYTTVVPFWIGGVLVALAYLVVTYAPEKVFFAEVLFPLLIIGGASIPFLFNRRVALSHTSGTISIEWRLLGFFCVSQRRHQISDYSSVGVANRNSRYRLQLRRANGKPLELAMWTETEFQKLGVERIVMEARQLNTAFGLNLCHWDERAWLTKELEKDQLDSFAVSASPPSPALEQGSLASVEKADWTKRIRASPDHLLAWWEMRRRGDPVGPEALAAMPANGKPGFVWVDRLNVRSFSIAALFLAMGVVCPPQLRDGRSVGSSWLGEILPTVVFVVLVASGLWCLAKALLLKQVILYPGGNLLAVELYVGGIWRVRNRRWTWTSVKTAHIQSRGRESRSNYGPRIWWEHQLSLVLESGEQMLVRTMTTSEESVPEALASMRDQLAALLSPAQNSLNAQP